MTQRPATGHTSSLPEQVPDHEVTSLVRELSRYLEPDAPAVSMPPSAYHSSALYEFERSRIFGRSWLLVAHADQLAVPGDYVSLEVAGEPVTVVRDRSGTLHALSPVCRHRMMPVVEPGAGRTDAFTCPYHLWRYGLDGRLSGATHMRGNPAFDPDTCRLPEFAVEEWRGFVYLNFAPQAEPVSAHLERHIGGELAAYRLEEMVQVGAYVEEWQVNWKLAVENSHENYHVMGLHPNTVALITPRGADMDVRVDTPWVLRLRSPFKEPLDTTALDLSEEQLAFMYNCCVFPSSSLATFGDSVVWISFIPLSVDRTQVRGGILMPASQVAAADREALRKQTEEDAGVVNGEDRWGLERVQRVVGSRFAGRGHLSPKEPGVLAFYRGLARAFVRDDADWPGAL
ncbi:diguanylate cyclase [Streptomyces nigrescens]|uniref:Diguanylate cyclase n=1 Tax=Streptomyces nigrescens TaxID=1920 RepID=A0ABM7ZY14_STRNI|nr:aromatic ring-hydroxylating dioxygenase subunit alpha [Streptomyces nigrescens]BDM71252.1 diguanylate cyclase [Streptomyces nigrescens]